jgi:DNA-binding NarL/FixJ family response regulator
VAIIEPQRLFGPFLSQLLANAGFTVVSSTDSILVDELGRADPTVVLIDIDFIEGDALAALKLLRSIVPNATICTFTGKVDQNWAVACLFAGANRVISKLASPPEFIDSIQRP